MTPAALPSAKAAEYIGVHRNTLSKLPIKKANVAPAGSRRATWVYLVAELDAFLARRTVKPGY